MADREMHFNLRGRPYLNEQHRLYFVVLLPFGLLILVLFVFLYWYLNNAFPKMSAFNCALFDEEITNRREPYHVEDDVSIPLEHFYIPEHYRDTLSHVLMPHGAIMDRVEKLAYDISKDYKGHTIHMLCVLKGASTFFGDLTMALRRFHDYARLNYIPYTFDFVRVKSYEGMESKGRVEIQGCDVSGLAGKHVLFVEDIIDTGLTMSSLLTYLNEQIKPASVRVASLVEKRTHRSCGFKADYVGFSIPDVFVCGYCLDYNEVYRDMKHLVVLNQTGIDRFRDYEI